MSDNSGISVGEYGIRSCIMESVGQHKSWDEKNDPKWVSVPGMMCGLSIGID
jgi:hypothetical protein